MILFEHPFMMTAVGPSQCGKMLWIYKWIKYLECMIYPLPKHIFFFNSSEYQSIFDEMKREVDDKKVRGLTESFKFIKCEKSIPAVQDVVLSCNNALLVLDCKENLEVLNNYAMKDCYCQNISVLFICQDMYENEKLRQIQNNSMYQVVFNNKGDRRNLHAVFHNCKKHNRCISICNRLCLSKTLRLFGV